VTDHAVRISGHRVSLTTDPENTIRSCRRAVSYGATVVELDSHRSADGELIVMHDETVDRTTDGTGRVNDLDLATIRTLRAGGEPIPTFLQVVEAIEVTIQVEIKDPLAVEPLIAFLLARPELSSRLVLSSFDDETIRALAEALPEFPRGLITSGYDENITLRSMALGCTSVYTGWDGLSTEAVEALKRHGLAVVVWTVDTPEALEKALALGVDEVSTNRPGEVVTWLRRRSV